MLRHYNRKHTCKPILDDISINELKEIFLNGHISNLEIHTTKIPHLTTKIPQKNIMKCEYCENKYSRKDSLNRHYKTCKAKKKEDEERKNLLELVNKLNEQLVLTRFAFKMTLLNMLS
jgi:hypothetical protein